jgi:hypothetical protein
VNFLAPLTGPTPALRLQGSLRSDGSVPETSAWDVVPGLVGVFFLIVLLVVGVCVGLSRWVDGRRIERARRAEIAVDVAALRARSTEPPAAGSADHESAPGGRFHSRPA